MAIDFTGTAPITGGGQVFVRNSNGEWEKANVTAPGVVVQTFTANGTYTPSPGMIACRVILTGAGGGGGGADTDGTGAAGGGGGEAGGTCIKLYTAAEIGASAAVVIGGGGTGGADTGGDATDGGDSTFTPTGSGVTLTAGGGDGGNGENATGYPNQAPGGFNEGTATNGDINLYGGHGQYGFGSTDGAHGGAGGASFWGGGGRGGSDFGGGGTTGQVPSGLWGCGGGGAAVFNSTTGVAGGDGVGGFCYIEEYIRQSVLSPIAYDSTGATLLDLSTDGEVSVSGDLIVTTDTSAAATSLNLERGAASIALPTSYASLDGGFLKAFQTSGTPGFQRYLDIICSGQSGTQDGRIRFFANSAGSAATEIVRIDLDGIKFNADTAAANALDDYEEGSWTPALDGSTTSPSVTYTAQVGRYTKIGNTVHFWGELDIATVSGGTGNLQITGLPFTINASPDFPPVTTAVSSLNWGDSTRPMGGLILEDGGTTMRFRIWGDGQGLSTQAVTISAANDQYHFSGTYRV